MNDPISKFDEFSIAPEDPTQAEVITLLRKGEEYSAELYPAESNHHLPIENLRQSNVRFLVGRDGNGHAIATGALVLYDGWAEVKAMWVEPAARGHGLSKAIITTLEAIAAKEDVRYVRLETGVESHAALGLYERMGFKRRAAFGDYQPDPLSVFMEKEIIFGRTGQQT